MPKKLTFLKIIIENHPLFSKQIEFSVLNDTRVAITDQNNDLTHLYQRLWTDNVITIVGKNATGKTTIMKTIIGMLTFLLNDKSIEQTQLADVLLGTQPITITTFFYGEDRKIYKDVTVFKSTDDGQRWHVDSEKIYVKKIDSKTSKKKLFDFPETLKPEYDRNALDPITASVLANDDSIFRMVIATEKYTVQLIVDTLIFTNFNALIYAKENVPEEILKFLDPTIEYLKVETKSINDQNRLVYRLKFKNQTEEFVETNFTNIEHYLSSGTAKGVTLYGSVLFALKTGGIIFIDELENHFNHAIVQSFIEYFTNPRINKKRATLIYSTHYSELLSDIDRSDEIYITRRDPKISLLRYSDADVRKDLNKTNVFDSDYLGGTAPEYESYLKLLKATEKAVK